MIISVLRDMLIKEQILNFSSLIKMDKNERKLFVTI